MIWYYLTLIIASFIIFLILVRKRNIFHRVAEGSIGLVNELLGNSGIDDDELIKKIQGSTNKLLLHLLYMFLLLIVAFALGAIPVILYYVISKQNFSDLNLGSFYAILSISVGATIPFLIPQKNNKSSSYSELSILLHRMILNNYNVAKKLFQIESKRISKKGVNSKSDFVIITGLARAGTTSLMTELSQMPEFVSLNYANMPFLTSPNIWRKIYHPKKDKLRERSHKDGIMMGFNSTEALEEYFFKMIANDSFIQKDHLNEYELSSDEYQDYLTYQRNIRKEDQKYYLAKNNNFLLRYKSLRSYNDDFHVFILFRDPLSHAASLMEKHHEYVQLQTEDPFVLEYMNWLGHHEFGLDQKPFLFKESKQIIEGDRDSLDYWLNIWINYYSNAVEINHPNTIFVNYDEYCSSPNKVISGVLEKVGIVAKLSERSPFINKRKIKAKYTESLYLHAQKIFKQLNEKAS